MNPISPAGSASFDWIKRQSFQNFKALELFERVESRAKESPDLRPKAWLFDLDSTLFSVSGRTRAIFLSYLREHPAPKKEWYSLYEHLSSDIQQYGVVKSFVAAYLKFNRRDALEKARAVWREFESYWMEHFFSNRFLIYDKPYPGAVEFVKKVHDSGYQVVYLTGRNRLNTVRGTQESLKFSGFPLFDERVHLLMRGESRENDLQFKRRVSQTLRRQYSVLCSIDNEPENVYMFAEELRNAEIVLYNSVCSDRHPQKNIKTVLGHRQPLALKDFE